MRSQSLIISLFLCLLTLLIFSARASAQTTWTFCANEGGTCSFSGTQQVRYGANGAYVYKTLTGGTACTNSVFGDPAYGTAKQCEIGSAASTSSWTFCASEGGFCGFTGAKVISYGANGLYYYKIVSDGASCTNSVFGDPAAGTVKSCAIGSVSISPPPPSSDWTFCAWEGNFCGFAGTKQVRYGADGSYAYKTLTDGTPCTNSMFGDPIEGSVKHCAVGAASISAPPASAVGPQPTITCPAGAVDIWPGQYIQGIINLYPGTTTFCLRAGVHYLTSSITPKTSDVFVGEYGAILDGSNWSTTDSTQAAFRAHNQDIDYVTIRNLVIRKMPQRGIHAYYYMADHWTIEYNEIASGGDVGIVLSPSSVIRNNYIHHNTLGGYAGQQAHNTTLESNEIAYNGGDQKVGASTNVTFRNNFVHHNTDAGIWFDSDNTGTLIEGNRVEDNSWMGIFYEISHDAIIRNNTIRRNGEAGIMLSV